MDQGPSLSDNPSRSGVLFGVAAYALWGCIPIYFKAVAHVPALEVLAHRILWSVLILVAIMSAGHRWRRTLLILRHRRTLACLAGTTLLIATNWYLFIWAIAHGLVLQASLGYFINPLVNVLLGYLFLKERLRRPQILSVWLACGGVLVLTIGYGKPPVISLILAVSFGFYGLLRKITEADSVGGLTSETLLLLGPALGYLFWLGAAGRLAFGHLGPRTDILLAAAGPVTAVPLLFFASAARRLRYATVGILQYIAPSLQFLLAVFAYGEAFTTIHLVSFGCIWTALAIYTGDGWRESRLLGRAV
jgi:chloramphenicol-sensitive protein RarD